MTLSAVWQRHRSWINSAIGLLFLAAGLWLLARALRGYSYQDVLRQLEDTPAGSVGLAAGFVAISYVALYFYDALGLQWLRYPMPRARIAEASFLASAFATTLGFPVLTGGATRLRYYSVSGLSAMGIAQLLASTYVTAWAGFMTSAAVPFIAAPLELPASVPLPVGSVRLLGAALLVPIGVFLLFSLRHHRPIQWRGHTLYFPDFPTAFGQVFMGTVKWTLGALSLYVLLECHGHLPLLPFLTAYFLAQFAAILTHSPGGLGVFDATLLLLVEGSLQPPQIVGGLLAWRAIYNLLPLAAAVPVVIRAEMQRRRAPGRERRRSVRPGTPGPRGGAVESSEL